MSGPAKPLNRTRLIGFAAMGVCILGYGGMGLALLLGKLGHVDMVPAAIWAAVVGIIGEIGLWVGGSLSGAQPLPQAQGHAEPPVRTH